MALVNGDRVGVAALGDDLLAHLPPVSDRAQVWRAWGFLERLQTLGGTYLGKALSSVAARYSRRASLSVLVSDLLNDSDWRAGLRALRASRQEAVLL